MAKEEICIPITAYLLEHRGAVLRFCFCCPNNSENCTNYPAPQGHELTCINKSNLSSDIQAINKQFCRYSILVSYLRPWQLQYGKDLGTSTNRFRLSFTFLNFSDIACTDFKTCSLYALSCPQWALHKVFALFEVRCPCRLV